MMSGTYTVVMGDRGRLVVPMELRERLDLRAGSTLLLLETPEGIVVATRDQAKRLIRHQLQGGGSVVDELVAERRQAADAESRE
jgi:AbrB family looped-hinge helix DNA binding protein